LWAIAAILPSRGLNAKPFLHLTQRRHGRQETFFESSPISLVVQTRLLVAWARKQVPKPKESHISQLPQGRGDNAAFPETTRQWSFHGRGRGRRPSASLCGNLFGFGGESEIPAGAFANRGVVPAPFPGFYQKTKIESGKKGIQNHCLFFDFVQEFLLVIL